MRRLARVLLFLILMFCSALAQHEVDYQFSHVALQIPEYLGRRNVRQNWMIVPHLFEGEDIRINFCLNQRTIVKVNSITYSNDGAAKTISVSQNGLELGRFDTHSDSDWGRLWDKPVSSASIGQTSMLDPGKYELKLKVEKSNDCYGFEPWSLQVSVFAASDPSKLWCGSDYTLVPKKAECSPGGASVDVKPVTTSTTPPTTTTTLPPTYVHVSQMSYNTDCFDRKNVAIKFTTQDIGGAVITLRQERLPSRAKQFQNEQGETHGKLCESEIWQLGKIDKDNREFSPIYPGKSLSIELTDEPNQEKKFPMKLLPFVTTDLNINFEIPPNLKIETGSAYFVLGLFNLTKHADIGMRYFDHTIKNFSNIHVISYSPEYQVMGWNVPALGKTRDRKNAIHLHFQSEANVIMFDFLKLQYTKHEERKTNEMIARRGHWKIRGLRFTTSNGMKVVVDDKNVATDIDDAILMFQISSYSRYHTVLRINTDGTFYPYKSFRIKLDQRERAFVDVSGFSFNHGGDLSKGKHSSAIRSLNVDTSTNVITTLYHDGSILRLRLVATSTETKLQIISYEGNHHDKINDAQSIVFTSTYVSDYFAAANTLAGKGSARPILSKLESISGEYSFTFRKTSPTNIFYANNFIKIDFPK